MKTPLQIALILAIGIGAMLLAGCEEQNLTNVKKSRLVAIENVQLKKELKQHDKKIEKLKKQYDTQMEKQRDLLEKCLQEKEDCEDKLNKGFQEEVSSILDAIMEENAKLCEENDKLKVQVLNLEARIQQLEKELEELKGQSGPQPLSSTAPL